MSSSLSEDSSYDGTSNSSDSNNKKRKYSKTKYNFKNHLENSDSESVTDTGHKKIKLNNPSSETININYNFIIKVVDEIDSDSESVDTTTTNSESCTLQNLRKQVEIINKTNKGNDNINDKILLSNLDINTKAILINDLDNHKDMDSSDKYKFHTWINQILKLPIGIYKEIVNNDFNINTFLLNSREKLDSVIYGMEETKEEIIDFLVNYLTNNNTNTVLGLKGPKGVGKTKICRALSEILNLPFFQLSLGGLLDPHILLGHDRTYIGSKCGKIASFFQQAQCMNYILYIDELDKCGTNLQSKGIYGVLTHLLDETQNKEFQDLYLDCVKLDLSKLFIITSFNNEKEIDPIVLNRIKTINIKKLSINDKIQITKKHILPELNNHNIIVSDDIIKYIILNKTEQEDGMRFIKKNIEQIFNRLNTIILLETCKDKSKIIYNFSYQKLNISKNHDNNYILTHNIVDILLNQSLNQEHWKNMYI